MQQGEEYYEEAEGEEEGEWEEGEEGVFRQIQKRIIQKFKRFHEFQLFLLFSIHFNNLSPGEGAEYGEGEHPHPGEVQEYGTQPPSSL